LNACCTTTTTPSSCVQTASLPTPSSPSHVTTHPDTPTTSHLRPTPARVWCPAPGHLPADPHPSSPTQMRAGVLAFGTQHPAISLPTHTSHLPPKREPACTPAPRDECGGFFWTHPRPRPPPPTSRDERRGDPFAPSITLRLSPRARWAACTRHRPPALETSMEGRPPPSVSLYKCGGAALHPPPTSVFPYERSGPPFTHHQPPPLATSAVGRLYPLPPSAFPYERGGPPLPTITLRLSLRARWAALHPPPASISPYERGGPPFTHHHPPPLDTSAEVRYLVYFFLAMYLLATTALVLS